MTCECNLCFGKGLANDTNETVLKDAFGQHGEIIEGDVMGSQYPWCFFIPDKFFKAIYIVMLNSESYLYSCGWKIRRIWVCVVQF